jgi:hypothetical protein
MRIIQDSNIALLGLTFQMGVCFGYVNKDIQRRERNKHETYISH